MSCFPETESQKKDSICDLLTGIWCVPPPEPKTETSLTWDEADAYFRHYQKLLGDRRLVDGIVISVARLDKVEEEIVKLVHFVRSRWDKPIDEIEEAIMNNPDRPAMILKPTPDAARKALILALRLWLFTIPDFSSPVIGPPQSGQQSLSLILREAVSRSFPGRSSPKLDTLTEDFSGKSLIRKGGFDFEATGDLSEHLTFCPHARRRIRVFGCIKALEAVGISDYK